MRSFFKTLILAVFLSGITSYATAQSSVNLIITKTDGEVQTLTLSNQSQFYFEDGERLVIDDGNNGTQTYQLSQIRKMVCTEILSNEENYALNLQLFPNPSHNSFIVKGLSCTCTARIYTLDGRLMKSFEATESQSVDISELPQGMYLLHITGQTLKLMKL